MLSLGACHVHVIDVDSSRAEGLVAGLSERFGFGRASALDHEELPDALGEADGLIHATPTGMRNHPGTTVAWELLRPSLWVAEVVYMPLETQLLRDARHAGCRTLDGGGMVAFQAAGSLELFTGVAPDRYRMASHLAELVAPEREEARCEPQSQPSR
jgi:shikimate dehydrogenase